MGERLIVQTKEGEALMAETAKSIYAGLLELLISSISERCYCASWLSGIEIVLWEIVFEQRAPELRQSAVWPSEIDYMRLLSNLSDGWIHFPEDAQAPVFIERAAFKRQVDEYRRAMKEILK